MCIIFSHREYWWDGSSTPFFRIAESVNLLNEPQLLTERSTTQIAVEDTNEYVVTLMFFGESPRTQGRDCHGVVLTSPDPMVVL